MLDEGHPCVHEPQVTRFSTPRSGWASTRDTQEARRPEFQPGAARFPRMLGPSRRLLELALAEDGVGEPARLPSMRTIGELRAALTMGYGFPGDADDRRRARDLRLPSARAA